MGPEPTPINSAKGKRATHKSELPKKLDQTFLQTLEQLGAAQLDVRSMAAVLGCSEDEFRSRMRSDDLFSRAINRGRAVVLQNCAITVVKAAQGEKIDEGKLKAAMFYLEKHSPQWNDKE